MNNQNVIQKLVHLYFGTVLMYFVWMSFNELHFHQYDPIFYRLKLDLTGLYLNKTGWHLALMESRWLQWMFDLLFLLMPFAIWFSVYKRKKASSWLVISTIAYNILYAWFYSTIHIYSIEVFTAFIFTPILFSANDEKSAELRIRTLRILFLIIFFSTGVWKLRAGGFFNVEQMSGILLSQHATFLAYNPNYYYTSIIHWLIEHPLMAQLLYGTATIVELMMCIGFFTFKWDRRLMILALLFVVMDYVLMHINYFPWLPMIGTLWFTRHLSIQTTVK